MKVAQASWLVFGVGISVAAAFGLLRDRSLPLAGSAAEALPSDERGQPPVGMGLHFEHLGSGLVRSEVALLGSSFVFVVEAPEEPAERAIHTAVEGLRELEEALSSWRPSSEVYALNVRAGIEPVPVGEHTLAVLERAVALYHETEGAFDVTIGPVWDLWPFRDPQRPLPSVGDIQDALTLVDASRIELDRERSTAYLPTKGMKVNLGAIGKGYAAELAVKTLMGLGIRRAAVGAGGDLYLLGRKSTGPWVVGVEDPAWPGRYIERFVAGDTAVATSGASQRYVIRAGKRYGHILDPRTGQPAVGSQSVTIITADATAADAYATAVFVMGPEDGMAWVETRAGVEALIVDDSGEQFRSSGWRQMTGERAGEEQGLTGKAAAPAADSRVERTRSTPVSPAAHARVTEQAIEPRLGKMLSIPAWISASKDASDQTAQAAFRIDRTEVSNEAYAEFLAGMSDEPHRFCHPGEPKDKDHRPRYWREFRSPLFLASVASRLAPFDTDTFRKPKHPRRRCGLVGCPCLRELGRQAIADPERMAAGGAGSGWAYLAVGRPLGPGPRQ